MENQEEQEVQPVLMDVVSDARMQLDKIAQVLIKIAEGMTAEEKMEVQEEFESIAYSAMLISMDAKLEMDLNLEEEEE